jgi:two-component system, sensor histidine kinase PhcS
VKNKLTDNAEALQAYRDYERQIYVKHLEIGCYLVMVLMPAGVVLDLIVYPGMVPFFFKLRLVCAVFAGGIWLVLRTPLRQRIHRFLSLIIALLPSFFICWMIHATGDIGSPYYAGLNLVLLAIALIMRWSVDLSIIASVMVMLIYLATCFSRGQITAEHFSIFFNNIYFLSLTSVIVIVGGWVHRALRISEFALNYELEKNRKALETSLAQLKENEVQLVHSEKLASLGRMSAGMIHEINNPLNFTTTALFTLRKKGKFLPSEQQKDFAETLKDVEEGVGRVKTIVSDLRVFTRPDSENCDDVLVTEAVTAALRFLNFERKDEVQIEQELTPNLKIWANKNKLIHVLANLLQNSFDALKTKTFTDERPTIRITGREENRFSILTVRDNGPGIPEDHLQKIFDPFFTTKDVGAGMGLGLSICYRLVQETQGKISVKTEVGKFCEFTLEFPARKKQTVAD